LNETEATKAVNYLAEKLDGGTLKDMYASSSRYNFAKKLILPHIERVAKNRKHIKLPTQEQMIEGLKLALEANDK